MLCTAQVLLGMASESRVVQARLDELEKLSASIKDQLAQAAKFVGVQFEENGRLSEDSVGREHPKVVPYRREEWLLIWLLKKLKTEQAARISPSAWWLLLYLVKALPVRTAARILITREVIVEENDKAPKAGKTSILQQTLADALSMTASKDTASATVGQERPAKASKKRKHTGELVESSGGAQNIPHLLDAISAVLSSIIQAGNVISGTSKDDVLAALSAAYMKSVFTTTAEKAAITFGSYLSLCHLSMPMAVPRAGLELRSWIRPPAELWESRVADDNSPMQFSLHCTRPVLALLKATKDAESLEDSWQQNLETLVAKNIIIPAREAKISDAQSELLSTLTRASVLQDTSNAPVFFHVAARSFQPSNSRHRRPQDDAWLQTVFDTLKSAMPKQAAVQHGDAVAAMIRCAQEHKVRLELDVLRAVTTQFALIEGRTDWKLLISLIKLDSNIFLIPNEGNELLDSLFARITRSSLEPDWPEVSELVVSQVLVPIVGEFSKARNLSGFIRHWHAQLIRLENLRKEARLFSRGTFGAWEDDALQLVVRKLLRPSLTAHQIEQVVEWLSLQVVESPNATCVILEAIAGAISGQELVDLISLRLYHVIFDDHRYQRLDSRYSWRAWRVMSQTLDWALPSDLETLASIWEQQVKPFGPWSGTNTNESLLEIYGGDTVALDNLESLRCACAAYSASETDGKMENLIRPILLCFLTRLARDLKQYLPSFAGNTDVGEELCVSKQSTLYRGIGWMLWSFTRCIFVEHPKTLQLALDMKGDTFQDMLQNIFWLSSASFDPLPNTPAGWLHSNSTAFPSLWTTAMEYDEVLNNKILTGLILDTMLRNLKHVNNPLRRSEDHNAFVIHALNHTPFEVINKNHREEIMKGWLELEPLDPAVIALKRRVMSCHPNLYEGLKFKTLFNYSTALSEASQAEGLSLESHVAILKDLVRLVMSHANTNLDQDRRKLYVADAFNIIQKSIKKSTGKKSHPLGFAAVGIINVALSEFNKQSSPLDELAIITKEDLATTTTKFKELLPPQLKNLLHQIRKRSSTAIERVDLLVLTDSLNSLRVEGIDLTDIRHDAKKFIKSREASEPELAKRLDTFLVVQGYSEPVLGQSNGGVFTLYSRESIKEIAFAAIAGKENSRKQEMVKSILGDYGEDPTQINRLLELRHIIASVEDINEVKQKAPHDSDSESDSDSDEPRKSKTKVSLTEAYLTLCGQLQKTTNIFQFCLVSETLEFMLKSKGRCISQYTIDTTLASIAIICSPTSPWLPITHCGTIYLHMCSLLRTILTHHRLKLQGHFPILQLSMQGLLRCLFRPLPHSNPSSKSTVAEFGPAPHWLSSSKHQLSTKHAEAYTRLVTLICDPSASSVRDSKHNNLTSAIEKWKRMALLYMRFVLMDYIKWQLEMRMLPEVREKLVLGLYAIFDTTTLETRRLISSELSTSGGAVFGMLYRDYMKFGKWKGS